MFSQSIKSCFRQSSKFLLVLLALGYVIPAFAADATITGLDAQSMLNRIAEQMPSLMRMVTAIAYVMGLSFVMLSLFKFKVYGEQRTMMSSQHHLREPLTYLVVGMLLLYLPSSVQMGMSTFWAEPNPYGYLEDQTQWVQVLNNAYMVIQLFGTIAFIRGLIIISHTGGHHGGQSGMGKGLIHIIGGIFCINIYQFVNMVLFTLGIQTS